MPIGVLGPLRVNGDGASLQPRDRVVLEVLALRPGAVVSPQTLAGALWQDVTPPTWNKVVQGSVVRLRKVLGAAAIETSAAGYRLTVPPDDLDAQRFERLVLRSRELLTLGDLDRAAYTSGEALALWRGPALLELSDWDAGRIEARRLDELRLEAEETHLEAALQAGRHREVLGEARARATEAPLREHRWALLAVAQYRTGRQGEALRTLHHARRLLAEELGIEPGPDLVSLEQAILRQDPTLGEPPVPSEASTRCPYLGLVPYDVDDADAFFGRDAEVDACLTRLRAVGVLAVVGPSGSGKSSLVRAGVAAALRRNRFGVTVITPGAHPMDSLTGRSSSTPPSALVVDQCEEAVTLCADPDEQAAFFAALARQAKEGPLIVAWRADRLGELSAHPAFAQLVEPGLHLLSPMSDAELRAAVEGPARQAGLLLEPGLVDLLVREVEGESGALPLLSHALRATWQRREGRTLTVSGYQATGGIRGAVTQTAETVYGRIPEHQQPVLRDVLLRLVTSDPDGVPIGSRVPRRLVATDSAREQLIELLVQARLVTGDDRTVQLAHESLARTWPRLRGWLDDDVEGQRVLRHLATTADTWNGMGRPDSELYRGVRLAQAVDWRARQHPELTPLECQFLDASQELERREMEATEQRLRQQARQNRRLRTLLGVTAVLLALALVAGAVALVQSRRTSDQRDRADAAARESAVRALMSQTTTLRDTQRDLAALLSIEAYRLEPDDASRAALFGTFTRDPGFEGVVPVPAGAGVSDSAARLVAAVAAPDGKRAFVTNYLGRVHAVDLDDRSAGIVEFPDPGFSEPAENRLAISTDGTLLAEISGSRENVDAPDSRLVLYDVPNHTFRVPPIHLDVNVGDVAISPDGRWVVVAGGERSEALVYRSDTGVLAGTIPGMSRPLDSKLFFNTAAVTFARDGRLFVSSEAGPVRIFDPATLDEIGWFPGPIQPGGTPHRLVMSPDGRTLVGTSEFGTVTAWDVASGTVRWSHLRESCSAVVIPAQPGTVMYCGGTTGQIVPLDLVSGDATGSGFQTQQGADLGLAVTVDSTRLLYTSDTRPVLGVWRLDGGGPIQRTIAPGEEPRAYSPDGTRLLMRDTAQGGMSIWDPTTGALVDPLDDLLDSLFFLDGSHIAADLADGETGVYDDAAHQVVMSAQRDVPPRGAAPDYGGHRLLVFYQDGVEQLYDLTTGGAVGPDLPVNRWTNGATFTTDGRFLALSDSLVGVSVLDTTTGQTVAGPVANLAFTAIRGDGLLVATTHNGELSFRDAVTLRERGPAMALGPELADGNVQFSADGSLLRVSAPGETTLVDVDGRTPLGGPLQVAGPTVLRPDGRELAVTTPNGVALWDLQPEHWVDAACRVASRNLTRAEWATYIGDLAPYHETCTTA